MQSINILNSPVNFKKINEGDFAPFGYDVSKNMITPTEEGYISNQVQNVFNWESRSTVVINAGVGQGKTHTVMSIAQRYYNEGFVLVFAVPYRSLISQYVAELDTNTSIKKEMILDFRLATEGDERNNQEERITIEDAANYNVHIVTINGLLGNPGEKFVHQADIKKRYFNSTIERIKNEGKKVVLILDEVHDSIASAG